jgi:hypothetical protein
MSTQAYKHILVLEIKCFDLQEQKKAQDRLIRWLETYGHTAAGHGFEFLTMSVSGPMQTILEDAPGQPH